MFKRIDTVFLPVRNLDRAIAWYTETFGFTLRWKHVDYAAINVGETPMTLYQPQGEFKPVSDHMPFNFYHGEIDAAHARLQAAGATVGDVNHSKDFAFFEFTDPDGNRLGVCWFPEK